MTTWYAQNSSVDIDSVNEWNDAAGGGGAWLTWGNLAGADILEANAQTAIEMNVDSFTCASIKTLSGGGFTVDLTAGNNRVINADIIAGTTPCLVRSGTTNTLRVNGNVTGGSASGDVGIDGVDHNNMVINGNVTGGSNGTAFGIIRGVNSGVLTITGNVTAGSSGPAFQGGFMSTTTITGDVTATDNATAIVNWSGPYTVVLIGDIICASNGNWPVTSGSPLGVRLKWSNVASGPTLSVRDASLDPHLVKLPDYPAEAEVESGVDYDYTNLTGSFAGGAGTGPIDQQWVR